LFHSTLPDGSIVRRFLANLPIRLPRQVVGLSGLLLLGRANGTLLLRPALINALQAPFGRFREARIGLSPTTTKIGFVCEEGRTRSAIQLDFLTGTSKATSWKAPSASISALGACPGIPIQVRP